MDIYLDYEFLENFLLLDDDSEVFFRLKSLIRDPKNKNNLILNFDHLEYYNDPEKQIIVRHLAQNLDVKIEINCLTQKVEKIASNSNPSSIFLSELIEADIENYGYLNSKSNDFQKLGKILIFDNIPITNKFNNWNFLQTYKVPCNAMVISDNYLFTNDFGYENLKSILKNLLPETLKVTFDLSIIGYDKTNIQFNIKNEYNEIKKFLEFNFSYPINLSIIQVYNHKRSIYSNLARFNTDKGFSLFRNSKIEDRNETTLEYCPNGSKTLSDSPMTSFKFEIEKIRKKTETLSQNKPANFNKVIGNKNNRLFNIQKNRSITT